VGQCPECGKHGTIGTFCTNCEDSGLIYDTVDPNDNNQLSGDDKYGEVGWCPVCSEYGALGTLCTDCEDSGLIYDMLDSYDVVVSLGLKELESDDKSGDKDE
jgi:hypothetical protein